MRIRTAHMAEVRSERFNMVAPHICNRQGNANANATSEKKKTENKYY